MTALEMVSRQRLKPALLTNSIMSITETCSLIFIVTLIVLLVLGFKAISDVSLSTKDTPKKSKLVFIQGEIQYQDDNALELVSNALINDSRFKALSLNSYWQYHASTPTLGIRGTIEAYDCEDMLDIITGPRNLQTIDRIVHIKEDYDAMVGIWFIGLRGQWTDSINLDAHMPPTTFVNLCQQEWAISRLHEASDTSFDI